MRVRTLISLGIVGHFVAVATAVSSISTRTFPAPPLAIAANQLVLPYLRATNLNNSYRFFAPNPEPVHLLWFRVRLADGTVRWAEWPDPAARWRGIGYQRRLTVPFLLAGHLTPSPRDPDLVLLGPVARECIAAFARHLAHAEAGAARRAEEIQVYSVTHRMLMPYEVQMGWEPTDLRLYQPIVFLGSYGPGGEPAAGSVGDPVGAVVPPSLFASRVVRQALLPTPRPVSVPPMVPGPQPVRELLHRFPELRQTAGLDEGQLRRAIEQAILGRDRADRIQDPARRAYEQELRRPTPGSS